MSTTLYLSPHLDDVALSCAGGLLARRRRGQRVLVATVFTEGRGARARRREDQAALAALGVEALHLGLLDAPERLHVRPGFTSLALTAQIDAALVRSLQVELRRLIDREAPAQVFFPLGIGGHVDHRTLCAAWPAAGPRARFYEDRPYAFVPALRALRLLELRGGRLRAPAAAARLDAELRDCAAVDELVGKRERDSCLRNLAARLGRAHAGIELHVSSRLRRWSIESLPAATRLMQSYRSQGPWIDRVAAGYARFALHPRGGWWEREWHSAPGNANPGSGRARDSS